MMTNEDFNSWACDIANDYAQARQEMGPEDFQEWEVYLEERMGDHLEQQANQWHAKHQDRPKNDDVDDLPF
jgi:hypothetical protein